MWPWTKPPKRETRSYTTASVDVLLRAAAGSGTPSGMAHATAYAEAAAGMWARAGMAATIDPALPALTAGVRGAIFRDLVLRGESLWLIEVGRSGLRLEPASQWTVRGVGAAPDGWRYDIHRNGPDGTLASTVPAARVLHVIYSRDPLRPWEGLGPLQRAGETSDLLSALSVRMREEAGAPSALIVPMPANPDDDDAGDGRPDPTRGLGSDLAAAKGGIVLAETLAGGHGDKANRPDSDWSQRRIGSEIDASYSPMLERIGMAVTTACGIPAGLLGANSDGTREREGWRRFLHGTIGPVAQLLAEEVADKLDAAVAFDFAALYASDIVGRASAFQRLVTGGMTPAEAAGLSGLIAGGD